MKTNYLITAKTIEIFKQKARKLKQEKGISHTQALDEIAQQHKFNNWHHVSESYKALEATENAVQSGLMIAMDAKDADDFYDEKEHFVQDDYGFFFCEKDVYRDYSEAIDEDGIAYKEKYSEEELRQDFEDDCMMNYGFFRYANKALPKTISEVLSLIEACCFWQPEYIWLNGKFYNKISYLETVDKLNS